MTQAQLNALEHRLAYQHACELIESACPVTNECTHGRPFFDAGDINLYANSTHVRRALKYLRARGLIEDGEQPHSVRVKAAK